MSTSTPVACPTCSAAVPVGLAACPVCQQAIAETSGDAAITVQPGDDLAAAIAAARAGATITLAAGDHHVASCLTVTKALFLQGAGRDATRIVSTALGCALRYTGHSALVVRGVHLLHVGEPWAHVVVVESGTFTLQGCRFEDGKPVDDLYDLGDGLRVSGDAVGTVSRCEFLANGADGVAVLGSAHVTLEDNLFRGNRKSGVTYMERATGAARRNTCEGNARNGIAVFDEAFPLIEGNRLLRNRLSGLRYSDQAHGEAIGNHAEGNRNGISLDDTAAPRLIENVLTANAECGLQLAGAGTALAEGNRCEGNGWDGIVVTETAAPRLVKNRVTNNRRNGVAYFDQAHGRAEANQVDRNGCDGIALFHTAGPALQENRIEGNGWNGIVYFDEARGKAASNLCTANAGCGIAVTGRARPALVMNRLARNGEHGLAYRDQAAGVADGNVGVENGLGDLAREKGAKPSIDKGAGRERLAAEPVTPNRLASPPSAPVPAKPVDGPPIRLTPADDLAGAIAAAPAGARLELAAGVYPLARRLDVDKPLTIVGAGRDTTRIVGEDEGFVIRAYGRGGLTLRGLHLDHAGDRWAHVLMADGSVVLEDCRFTGASRDASSQLGGCGVWLCAKASGEVRGCRFSSNVYGLAVQGAEPIRLQENYSVDNEVGIAFLERTAAQAHDNRCEKNKIGMLVEAEARPELLRNHLMRNSKSGLVYQGQAAGTARDNAIEANGADGISVRGEAAPLIQGNRVVDNGLRGLQIGGTRGGRALENQIMGNGQAGIEVSGRAKPTIERNAVSKNRQYGLVYVEQGAGSAEENRFEDNPAGGIVVGTHAAPVIGPRQGEVTRGDAGAPAAPLPGPVIRLKPGADLVQAVLNAASDTEIQLEPGIYRTKRPIAVRKSLTLRAVGTGSVQVISTAPKAALRVTDAPRFAMHGIRLERDTARYGEVAIVSAGAIEMVDCVFSGGRNDTNHGHGGDGLRLVGKTRGTVQGCEFKNNQGLGIAVCEQAAPTLTANHVHHNHHGGIAYHQQTGGSAERNRCVNNHHSGITLFDQAAPTLSRNELVSNERSGIVYKDASSGVATGNTCSTNHHHGIELTGWANPRLEGNLLRDNRKDGLSCDSAAVRAVVKENVCERNGGRGIAVSYQHGLTLEGNQEQDNRGDAT